VVADGNEFVNSSALTSFSESNKTTQEGFLSKFAVIKLEISEVVSL
jgi:hypothetical protein